MISNLRISVAELIVWALLATAGLAWTVARVFDGIERAWNWLVRDRISGLLEDDDELTDLPPGMDLPPLPPERTWEQMTSHQLPVSRIGEDMSWWAPPERERRAPWWEAEHRAAYHALGLDYPSGLLARVRENL